MEINGDVTDAGRTDGRTREDRATQPMDAGWLSFAICLGQKCILLHAFNVWDFYYMIENLFLKFVHTQKLHSNILHIFLENILVAPGRNVSCCTRLMYETFTFTCFLNS